MSVDAQQVRSTPGHPAGVDRYMVSPRHAHFFATDAGARQKIIDRVNDLRRKGEIADKVPIVSIQDTPDIIELHDGNASLVAWLIYARERSVEPHFEHMARSFERVIVLRNRVHEDGVIWHPYVPAEVACADELEPVNDAEQYGRVALKALTRAGEAVYFNDDRFGGIDASEEIGALVDRLMPMLANDLARGA